MSVGALDEATLALVTPLLARMGVTRLADQTGLDILGVPVVAAFRPNSRSLAVHQGKGLTRLSARLSAIMEAAECFLAENPALPLRLAAADELPGALAPEALPLLPGRGPLGGERILWAPGVDLMSGRAAWAPYELVHADFTDPQPAGSFHFQATTNGMGAGVTAEQAQVHGLRELIERDAVAGWRRAGGPAARGAGALDLATVRDPALVGMLQRFRAVGVSVAAWSVGGAGPAVVQALIVPGDGGLAGIEPEMGAACHPEPEQAVLRAVMEAAQSRVTRISGARDDYESESYEAAARADRLGRARGWMRLAAAGQGIDVGAMPRGGDGLDETLEALRRHGCGGAVWVDLAQADVPIACGRAVVPGLSGPYVGG